MQIPGYVSKYLWDVDTKTVDLKKNRDFIAERVLEYGDFEAFRWLTTNYDKEAIIETLKNSRKISPKTGNFFALWFEIDKMELECIRKPFIQKQNRF